MNRLQQLEIDELNNTNEQEAFKVTDLKTANWVFKKIDAINASITDIEEVAKEEVEKIINWCDQETASLKQNLSYFESLVIDYYREQKEQDNKFKLKTPYGKVTSRKGSKVIQLSNEIMVIEQLEARGLTDYIKVTKKLNQQEIKKDFNATDTGTLIDVNGEILEGAHLVEKPMTFSVKVGE